jgi:hypothetical protein
MAGRLDLNGCQIDVDVLIDTIGFLLLHAHDSSSGGAGTAWPLREN